MSGLEILGDTAAVETIVSEQAGLLYASELLEPMQARVALLGNFAVSVTESKKRYKEPLPEVLDVPGKDLVVIDIDKPTITDMAEEYSKDNGLSEEDVLRLYVGMGLANMLVLESMKDHSNLSRSRKFFAELSRSQGLYAATMDSPVFDNIQADDTARKLSADGHAQTANVNAHRLRSGMFIEAQRNPKNIRNKVCSSFQDNLVALFDNKSVYMETVKLFGRTGDEAEDLYANNVETVIGISFPMQKKEIKSFARVLGS